MIEIDSSKIEILENLVTKANSIVITTHKRPDGDAIGSSLGIYYFLNKLGKAAKLVLNDKYPDSLKFMFNNFPLEQLSIYSEDKNETKTWIKEADLIFCMDFNEFHRTDKLESLLTQSKAKKILIDHHLNPDESLFDLVFSIIDISSASELTYHILMQTKIIGKDVNKLPLNCATALMTGMTTDTNNYYNSVYPSTFNMSSALLGIGVDRDEIISELYHKQSENRIRLKAYLLKNKLKITEYGVAYMILDQDTVNQYQIIEGETEGFVNIPLSIDKVKMSIFAKEDEDSVRISIRSKKGVSANKCAAEYFNGGGHELASGGTIYIGKDIKTFDELGQYIENCTSNFMKTEYENI